MSRKVEPLSDQLRGILQRNPEYTQPSAEVVQLRLQVAAVEAERDALAARVAVTDYLGLPPCEVVQ